MIFSKKQFPKNKGFTIIELLVVVAIIGLISTVVLVRIGGIRPKAKITSSLQFSQTILHTLGVDVVGIWEFDEGSDTIAYDRSGYGNNGTIYGATYTDDTPHKAIDKGAGKYALRFDGSNDYVRVPNAESLKPPSALTIEAWVNVKSFVSGSSGFIVCKSIGTYYYKMGVYLDGKPYSQLNENGGYATPLYTTSAISTETWYHLVTTYDGTTLKIYVNGIFNNSRGGPSIFKTNNDAIYMGGYTSSGYQLNGTIDEVRIYGRALGAVEIQKHYAEGLKKLKLVEGS